ncbi:Carbamoyltransferase [Candidatus Koribacter versatilis Ellin345]|uniref:Carbamoyltransferase n=1 Tax=Koribacter versatilis (strain Ellin345) TaxID=204669 RepID=Q1IU22_KORVE|nr:carbamoyltransferase C-terminal domain-containing protein [Candidatus Koribacter versatilis]ABF39628.1 Carbamoyltransferase [Candidatus Koribacter versatilis Ellin345]
MVVLGFSGIQNGEYYRQHYGLRFVGHDAAVALVRDGEVLFAAEEERFSRQKHTSSFPIGALNAALQTTGLEIGDIDTVAYPWAITGRKFLHMNLNHVHRVPLFSGPQLAIAGMRVIRDLMSPQRIASRFSAELGSALPRCRGVSHHMGHSACAYYTSPFDSAAVLTIDGQGEDESGSLGEWNATRYRHIRSIYSPDSIGILYGMITDFLGMRAAWDEYKVMGMASYGNPTRFAAQYRSLVELLPRGRYRTDRTAMVFKPGYCETMLCRTFGIAQRKPDEPLEQVHFDLAAALQKLTEDVVFHLLAHLRKETSAPDLCLAGGVFQNSVLNGKILRSGLFERVHVPPVPGDHGGALGAALFAYHEKNLKRTDLDFSAFTGPAYAEREIQAVLDQANAVRYNRPAELANEVAQRLAQGQVLGWFQGRMEYGPRALGHRSILASPLSAEMKDVVNERIKHRERFRPFAGAVPRECVNQYFELDGASPYMQFVVPVKKEAENRIPAVVHFGTCRAQTVDRTDDPLFHALLTAFGKLTGHPVLLNTSFNDADEPIVCSPADAVRTFLRTNLDAMALGPFLVERR